MDLELKEEKIKKCKNEENKKFELTDFQKKLLSIVMIIVGIIIIVLLIVFNKEGETRTTIKSTLDRVVQKSDLETVNFTYNVIAKKCKNNEECNLNSNNIDDFEYVISCEGTITSGIEFKDVKIDLNKNSKKLIVTLPDAKVKEINIGTLKYINGDKMPADELPNAIELCRKTIESKSHIDENLLPAAKEQAGIVLKSLYEQWLKAFDKDYKLEIK